jgi:hypothetical protein
MSDEDVIRTAIDAWNAGGVDAFMEYVTSDVDWHPPEGFPEGEMFSGRDAVTAALSDQFGAVFTSGRLDVRSVTPGPGGLLVAAHHEVEGQASGMELAWPVYLVFEFEGELIRRISAFLERDAAMHQAGVGG